MGLLVSFTCWVSLLEGVELMRYAVVIVDLRHDDGEDSDDDDDDDDGEFDPSSLGEVVSGKAS
jgi:hypothetical protein